jgi:hypothetical protein
MLKGYPHSCLYIYRAHIAIYLLEAYLRHVDESLKLRNPLGIECLLREALRRCSGTLTHRERIIEC